MRAVLEVRVIYLCRSHTTPRLRANGVPLPVGVMLAPANGGRVVEAAWRLVSEGAGRLDQWTELCAVAVAAVAHYMVRNLLAAEPRRRARCVDGQRHSGTGSR